ncbi:MAG TPA: DUF4258 domain-containing protein [Alphaproteobacteria bacterium]|nr:DUF4258 domain-containing protein [Alphaproteobacteria bacterium]
MNTTSHLDPKKPKSMNLSDHAISRMFQRSLPLKAVEIAKAYGRISHVRGARVYSVGRIEVERLSREGLDAKRIEGVHVVCSPDDDETVITVYRNRDFSILRPKRRRTKTPRLEPVYI